MPHLIHLLLLSILLLPLITSLTLPIQSLNTTSTTTTITTPLTSSRRTTCDYAIIGWRNPLISDCALAILDLPSNRQPGSITGRSQVSGTCQISIVPLTFDSVSWFEIGVAATQLCMACSTDTLGRTRGRTTVGMNGGVEVSLRKAD